MFIEHLTHRLVEETDAELEFRCIMFNGNGVSTGVMRVRRKGSVKVREGFLGNPCLSWELKDK